MSKRGHEWWFVYLRWVDHLYETCPGMQRTAKSRRAKPQLGLGLVDPLGPDICGWCKRVWKARNT